MIADDISNWKFTILSSIAINNNTSVHPSRRICRHIALKFISLRNCYPGSNETLSVRIIACCLLWLIYFILLGLESLEMAYTIWKHNKNAHLRRHEGKCNFTPLPDLGEDDGTTATRGLERCLHAKICFLSMNEANNPHHLDCGSSVPATHGG